MVHRYTTCELVHRQQSLASMTVGIAASPPVAPSLMQSFTSLGTIQDQEPGCINLYPNGLLPLYLQNFDYLRHPMSVPDPPSK